MSQKLLMGLGKKVVGKKVAAKQSEYKKANGDPYMCPDPKRPGKLKKKDILYFQSLGIPKEDVKVLLRVRKLAKTYDGGLRLGPMRLGMTTLIGLIPAFGDAIEGALAMTVVAAASQVSGGLDKGIRERMVLNVIIDVAIGLTPVLGDIADSFFQCNTKNFIILEKMLRKRAEKIMIVEEEEENISRGQRRAHAPTNGQRQNLSNPIPIRDEARTNGYHESDNPPRAAVWNHATVPIGQYDPEPTPNVPPRYEEQYGNMHERLGMRSAKDSPKKTQAPKSGNRWFNRSNSRGQNRPEMGEVAPARPARPGNPIYLGNMDRGKDVTPALPPRGGNTRRVNDGPF